MTIPREDRSAIPPAAGESGGSSALSLVNLGIALLRYRYLIAVTAIGLALISIAVGLLARRTYSAAASLMPQASDKGLSRFAGLAAQLGVPTSNGPTPDFYATVLTSRQLLRSIAESSFTVPGPGGPRTASLADWLDVSGNGAVRRERVVDKLRSHVGAVASARTGLIELSVRMPSPVLAHRVADGMIGLLNDFNRETRQSQARAERMFVERRLDDVRGDLRAAENTLQVFLQQNRDYLNSPQLLFQRERLQREVTLRQQLYASLVQSYEQSRIDEVRDTPVITIVESPITPAEPDSRRLLVRGIVGGLLGLMLGALLAVALESARRNRETEDTTYQHFAVLQRQAVDELKHPLRSLQRRS